MMWAIAEERREESATGTSKPVMLLTIASRVPGPLVATVGS